MDLARRAFSGLFYTRIPFDAVAPVLIVRPKQERFGRIPLFSVDTAIMVRQNGEN
jgi:hypothetical protein